MSEQRHPPAIQIQGVHQSFRAGFWVRKVEILKAMSFDIPAGSTTGFLGANGAGKTTLIQLITGLRKPTLGTVRVFGFDAESSLAKRHIGYLPERPYFYPHLTGEQFLRFLGTLSGIPKKVLRGKIETALQGVGLLFAKDRELRKYSKGMLQRIGIAQALLHEPELLVLDEPMSGLDPVGRQEIKELILEQRRQGRTIFFSTHILPDVEEICDQVALIRQGKLVRLGKIADFQPSLEAFFSEQLGEYQSNENDQQKESQSR